MLSCMWVIFGHLCGNLNPRDKSHTGGVILEVVLECCHAEYFEFDNSVSSSVFSFVCSKIFMTFLIAVALLCGTQMAVSV